MLNLDSVLVFSAHPEKLAVFYKRVFDKKPGWSDGGYTGFDLGNNHYFMVGPHKDVKGKAKDAKRIMINFGCKDVKKEFARIKKLGAKVVAVPYQPGEAPDMWLCTFADPDGNYFQLGSGSK